MAGSVIRPWVATNQVYFKFMTIKASDFFGTIFEELRSLGSQL